MRLSPPGLKRRQKAGGHRALAAGLASGLVHLALLAALVTAAHGPPPPPEPPSIIVDLMSPQPAPAVLPPRAPAPSRAKAAFTAARRAPAVPAIAPSGPVAPAIAAPSAFTVGGPGSAAAQQAEVRDTARAGIGCAHADFLKLTKAEKAACADQLGRKALTAPLYAVIDPEKKAAFDGDCKKDDDWCLYRTGKGPYPGLFALGRKHK